VPLETVTPPMFGKESSTIAALKRLLSEALFLLPSFDTWR